jgi:hypothetical protein
MENKMTFKEFKKLVDSMVEIHKKYQKINDLGINMSIFIDDYDILIDNLWSHILTVEGLDWLSWFLYEKGYIVDGIGRDDLTATDNGKKICKNLKGLYTYILENNYFK